MSTIYDAFIEQRQRLVQAYIMPTFVSFNQEGYMRAMKERDDAFGSGVTPGVPKTYCGLPYRVDHGQSEPIKLMSTCDSPPISFQVGHINPALTTMQVIGHALSVAQLSDIIMAWVNAHPNEQPMTDMLVDWVQTHGRFE